MGITAAPPAGADHWAGLGVLLCCAGLQASQAAGPSVMIQEQPVTFSPGIATVGELGQLPARRHACVWL